MHRPYDFYAPVVPAVGRNDDMQAQREALKRLCVACLLDDRVNPHQGAWPPPCQPARLGHDADPHPPRHPPSPGSVTVERLQSILCRINGSLYQRMMRNGGRSRLWEFRGFLGQYPDLFELTPSEKNVTAHFDATRVHLLAHTAWRSADARAAAAQRAEADRILDALRGFLRRRPSQRAPIDDFLAVHRTWLGTDPPRRGDFVRFLRQWVRNAAFGLHWEPSDYTVSLVRVGRGPVGA